MNGTIVSKSGHTDSGGCVTFDDLLPGNYTVKEVLASNWYASTATTVSLALAEGENKTVEFLNYCKGTAAMHTKGFWQNQGCYIVAPNSQDSRIGLAQQLMAFILNCRHGLDSLDAALILDIGAISAQDIISGAIDAWLTGEGVKFWQEELDAINNTALVDFISGSPCSVTY